MTGHLDLRKSCHQSGPQPWQARYSVVHDASFKRDSQGWMHTTYFGLTGGGDHAICTLQFNSQSTFFFFFLCYILETIWSRAVCTVSTEANQSYWHCLVEFFYSRLLKAQWDLLTQKSTPFSQPVRSGSLSFGHAAENSLPDLLLFFTVLLFIYLFFFSILWRPPSWFLHTAVTNHPKLSGLIQGTSQRCGG